MVPITPIVPFERPYAHPLPCGSIFSFSGDPCPLLCFPRWQSAQFGRQNPAIPSSTRLHASAPATSSETADLLRRQPMRPSPRQGMAGLSCALDRPDLLKRPPTCESGARLGPHPGSLRGHRETSASFAGGRDLRWLPNLSSPLRLVFAPLGPPARGRLRLRVPACSGSQARTALNLSRRIRRAEPGLTVSQPTPRALTVVLDVRAASGARCNVPQPLCRRSPIWQPLGMRRVRHPRARRDRDAPPRPHHDDDSPCLRFAATPRRRQMIPSRGSPLWHRARWPGPLSPLRVPGSAGSVRVSLQVTDSGFSSPV